MKVFVLASLYSQWNPPPAPELVASGRNSLLLINYLARWIIIICQWWWSELIVQCPMSRYYEVSWWLLTQNFPKIQLSFYCFTCFGYFSLYDEGWVGRMDGDFKLASEFIRGDLFVVLACCHLLRIAICEGAEVKVVTWLCPRSLLLVSVFVFVFSILSWNVILLERVQYIIRC